MPQDAAEAKSVIRLLKGLRTGLSSLLNTEVWSLHLRKSLRLVPLQERARREDPSRHACSPYSRLLKEGCWDRWILVLIRSAVLWNYLHWTVLRSSTELVISWLFHWIPKHGKTKQNPFTKFGLVFWFVFQFVLLFFLFFLLEKYKSKLSERQTRIITLFILLRMGEFLEISKSLSILTGYKGQIQSFIHYVNKRLFWHCFLILISFSYILQFISVLVPSLSYGIMNRWLEKKYVFLPFAVSKIFFHDRKVSIFPSVTLWEINPSPNFIGSVSGCTLLLKQTS